MYQNEFQNKGKANSLTWEAFEILCLSLHTYHYPGRKVPSLGMGSVSFYSVLGSPMSSRGLRKLAASILFSHLGQIIFFHLLYHAECA